MLSRERLVQLLHYNPSSGEWHWIVHRQCVRAGARAGSIKRDGRVKRRGGKYATKKDGRRRIRVDGKVYYSARLAWLYMTGEWPASEVDHKNLIRHDDAWTNLRLATGSQNCGNKSAHSNNVSGRKGVGLTKPRGADTKFMARIMKDGKSFYLGIFASADEASSAYARKAKELFGRYAKT